MNTPTLNNRNDLRDAVRETYGKVAAGQQNGCCAKDRPCATPADQLGYSPQEIAALPESADLGLKNWK